ncbi:BtpA/SgcQ family protein [Acidimangrovimonas sediminis]|uniref:BtpA/SgcQ family protein n=1 Tax=Acidimangrovimonas sediminis TaxID=2056283 RepID=UPI001E45ABE2|nr:BtpA/SgcQ family protein [Acidimangrovimonas sediminis]
MNAPATTPQPVFIPKPNVIEALFGRRKVAIGVIHAMALPGSARYDGAPMREIYDHATAEAQRYRDNGIDGVIVENHGDIPFAKPEEIGHETAAAMAVMTDRVRAAVGGPVGINVLANAPITALAAAKASGADFIRVNQWANAYVANEGFMEGRAGAATRYRAWIGARDVKVFADVHVKHGAHAIVADRPLHEMARDAEFFDADALIVTGQRTGDAADPAELKHFADHSALPLLVGSGVTGENVTGILQHADAVIVASSLKENGQWWHLVDPGRVRAFMEVVARMRG